MRKLFDQTKFLSAQSVTELAVFGAIIIFIIGSMLRQSQGFNYSQNQNLAAMRMAMTQSFKYSQGLSSPDKGNGDASRNSATVFVIEDRLTADSAKYGALDRSPQIAIGSATHSCNLFLPVEACEHYNIPVTDMYINGVYVALSIAKMETVNIPANGLVWEKIPNYGPMGYVDSDASRFDLDRNFGNRPSVAPNLRKKFSWQWHSVQALEGNIKEGDLFDVDGDLKEEQVMKIIATGGKITQLVVQDYQDGDLDNTYDTYDKEVSNKAPSGLTQNTSLYAYTQRPGDTTSPGTYLRIEEGKLLGQDKQIVRSTQRKDTIDLVSREIRLANDPLYETKDPPVSVHLFCTRGSPTDYSSATDKEKELSGYFHGMTQNPVEVCGDCNGKKNYTKTCYETGVDEIGRPRYSLFIRSRIQDRRGRKWITNIANDKYVDFKK